MHQAYVTNLGQSLLVMKIEIKPLNIRAIHWNGTCKKGIKYTFINTCCLERPTVWKTAVNSVWHFVDNVCPMSWQHFQAEQIGISNMSRCKTLQLISLLHTPLYIGNYMCAISMYMSLSVSVLEKFGIRCAHLFIIWCFLLKRYIQRWS